MTSTAQKGALRQANLTELTAKGCLPAQVVSLLAPQVVKNYAAIPDDIFNVCNPTTGSKATIDFVQNNTAGDWVALDLIGTFGLLSADVSIDNYPMYLYAVDGSYIEPMLVDAITIYNGARFSVLIKLTELGNFPLRVASNTAAQSISNFAYISYHAPGQPAPTVQTTPYINDVGVNTTADVVYYDQSMQKSYPPVVPANYANQTFVLDMLVAGQTYLWALNNSIYSLTNTETPVLLDPMPFVQNNVTLTTLNDTWVDIVFVTATYPQPQHPIHKHGNKMFLIGQAYGAFPYASIAEAYADQPQSFNFDTPPHRDSLTTYPTQNSQAWMAIRYYSDDPGAWLLHCHIQNHLSGGMAVVIQDGIDAFPTVPEYYRNFGTS